MHQWVHRPSHYHIAVINRHSQTWAWDLLQLHHPELLALPLVTSEDKIAVKMLAEVAVVEVLRVVDIKDATHSLYLRRRKLLN